MSEMYDDEAPLLTKTLSKDLLPLKRISTFFAVACIIDQFGVNPVVVLPKGIILCGWVGYPLAMFVFTLTIYTAILLGKCWIIAEHLDNAMILKSRYAYSALCEMAWGKLVGKIISLLINVSVFSCNIPSLLIASQNLQFFDSRISNFRFDFSYCYWLIILGAALCPLTWLGSPKDTKWISVISTVSVLTCAFLTWFCMLSDDTRASVYSPIPPPNWEGVSVALGILIFQFGSHPAILTIQTEMQKKSKLPRSILLSFLITGGLSLITIWLSGLLYGSGVHANLIQGLPINNFLYLDVLIVTLQLFLSTVVGQCTLFQDVEDKLGISRELCWQRCVVRSIIVALVVLFAEILPRFDLVMAIIGGLFTGPIIFIFPPLLYLRFRKILYECKKREKSEKFVTDNENISKRSEFSGKESNGTIEKPHPGMKTIEFKQFLKNVFSFFALETNLNEAELNKTETFVSFFIVGIGLLQTVATIYYSTKRAIESTKVPLSC